MSKSTKLANKILSLSYTGISLIGLVILVISTFNSQRNIVNYDLQRQFIGMVFVTICIGGIIVGVFPSSCSRLPSLKSGKKTHEEKHGEETTIAFIGHHPKCSSFSGHVFKMRRRTYCAGCTGLVIGALVSLFGVLLYLFYDFNFGENSNLIFWIGFAAVVCGLLQYQIPDGNNGYVHFFFNVIFPFGAFLLLVGVSRLTGNFVLESYLLALTIFWIITRITLSRLEHKKICATCLQPCSFL